MHAQGHDWNGQLKLGNNQFYGANYLQVICSEFLGAWDGGTGLGSSPNLLI
jgi:hypothetical protein